MGHIKEKLLCITLAFVFSRKTESAEYTHTQNHTSIHTHIPIYGKGEGGEWEEEREGERERERFVIRIALAYIIMETKKSNEGPVCC